MKKIGEINSNTENKGIIVITSIIVYLLLGYTIWRFYPVNYVNMINSDNVIQILLIPVAIIITLVIHELIHVALFKLYGRGEAIVRVKWIKEEGSIFVQQLNEFITYSKAEVISILITPLISITLISLALLKVTTIPLLIYINCMLNIVGSCTDIFVSLKLLTKYKGNIRVGFKYTDIVNMYIYNS